VSQIIQVPLACSRTVSNDNVERSIIMMTAFPAFQGNRLLSATALLSKLRPSESIHAWTLSWLKVPSSGLPIFFTLPRRSCPHGHTAHPSITELNCVPSQARCAARASFLTFRSARQDAVSEYLPQRLKRYNRRSLPSPEGHWGPCLHHCRSVEQIGNQHLPVFASRCCWG
jgi:hypothetical protein